MPHPRRPTHLLRFEPRLVESRAAVLVDRAQASEREGRTDEACRELTEAIALARATAERAVLAKALRRLAVLRHLRSEPGARALCRESFDVATELGDRLLAAEAENTGGLLSFEAGEMDAAYEAYQRALTLADGNAELQSRVEQNLGILANVQGDVPQALAHYRRSLALYTAIQDQAGCAIAYHNLGMISADQGLWDDAETYYRQSQAIAVATGDLHLQGLCLLNHAEVCLARDRHEEARAEAEQALRVFSDSGAPLYRADAYKVLGVVYRETGRSGLAEARLATAIELARKNGAMLTEAEATRELAVLYQQLGRNRKALRLLNLAHRLFQRLHARADLSDVRTRLAKLQGTFLQVVRQWGQSIESSDTYTFGHCERVASLAVAVARELGLDEETQTTIQVGAHLHDLGKVRVPHEILNKPGPLTGEEMAIIRLHPVHGADMLEGIEFPWDIKPIIRWHHEKADGSGYPDGLVGERIPLSAQVICVVDVYDAVTSTRSYRPAMSRERALEVMHEQRHWWRPEVYQAFLRSIAAAAPPERLQRVRAASPPLAEAL